MMSVVLKSRFLWTGRLFQNSCTALSRDYHVSGPLHSVSNKSLVDEAQEIGKTISPEEENEIVTKLKTQLDQNAKTFGTVPVFKRALLHGNNVAIKDQNGEFSYARLYMGAKKLSVDISNICGSGSNYRIAFLCPNDVSYPLIQWACWMSGQIAVPLSAKHPDELLKYFVADSDATLLIVTPEFEGRMKGIADGLKRKLLVVDHNSLIPAAQTTSWLDPRNELVSVDALSNQVRIQDVLDDQFYMENNAMLLYTSGTTGNPKGVIISHRNIESQIQALIHAWQFTSKDCLLHVLPLNHVHGCINGLLCPLHSGAKTIMLPRYETNATWSHLLNVNLPGKDRISVFMAVPTIYSFLIEEYNKIFAKNERMCEYIKTHCTNKVRLMVSGSAPLPTTVFQRWYEISGHRLLERYGMTEIGMALSNPLKEDKNRKRIPGTVGGPLPNVEVKIVSPQTQTTVFQTKGEFDKGLWAQEELPLYETNVKEPEAIVGDLLIRGPSMFKGYWNKPEATQEAFFNGWFKTGDTVSYENGIFRILGRTNIDIIKTGGHKVSALEVETILLEHPLISDCAVLGLPDDTWGQKVGVIVQLTSQTSTETKESSKKEDEKKKNKLLTLKELHNWCTERMAPYAIPTVLSIVETIPRNALGKVNKKEIVETVYNKQKELEQKKQASAEGETEKK